MTKASIAKSKDKFSAWLLARGAQILNNTNEWEMLRFKTSIGVSIIYCNSKGSVTMTGESKKAFDCFSSGASWSAGVAGKRKRVSVLTSTLLQRDGDLCFLCHLQLHTDMTVEHLVPLAHGGPNHLSNLVLMHGYCNHKVGHLSAMAKIKMREENRPMATGRHSYCHGTLAGSSPAGRSTIEGDLT